MIEASFANIVSNDIADRIDAFVAHADEVVAEYWKRMNYTFGPPPTHRAKILSKQWCKIINVEQGRDCSVYAFIALQDGETKTLGVLKRGGIYKAASYKAPAKHSRGNIFEADFGNCATPFGVNYLK